MRRIAAAWSAPHAVRPLQPLVPGARASRLARCRGRSTSAAADCTCRLQPLQVSLGLDDGTGPGPVGRTLVAEERGEERRRRASAVADAAADDAAVGRVQQLADLVVGGGDARGKAVAAARPHDVRVAATRSSGLCVGGMPKHGAGGLMFVYRLSCFAGCVPTFECLPTS